MQRGKSAPEARSRAGGRTSWGGRGSTGEVRSTAELQGSMGHPAHEVHKWQAAAVDTATHSAMGPALSIMLSRDDPEQPPGRGAALVSCVTIKRR